MENYKDIIDARKILENYNSKDLTVNIELESSIINKWKDHVCEGWYGIAIGHCPIGWYYIIDEFLDQIDKVDPKFEIHQIKLKLGGIRIYLSFSDEVNKNYGVISHINQQTAILEHELFHESLIF